MKKWIYICVACVLALCANIVLAEDASETKLSPEYQLYTNYDQQKAQQYVPRVNVTRTTREEPLQMDAQTISKPVNFARFIFQAKVDFVLSEIRNFTNFILAEFNEPASFVNTRFYGYSVFDFANFKNLADFAYSKFYNQALFYRVDFNDKANFFGARFNQFTNFSSSTWHKDADFTEATFMKVIDFEQNHFMGDAIFKKARFAQRANFASAIFEKGFDMSSVEFGKILDLTNAKFKGRVNFSEMRLPDILIMANLTEVKEAIDLTVTKLQPNQHFCYININGSNVDKINMRYKKFRLFFPSSAVRADIESVYAKLLNKFNAAGFKESAKLLDIEYQDYEYEVEGRWIKNIFEKYWWNYGYDKIRIFYWTLLVLSFFGLINSVFYRKIVTEYIDIAFLKKTIHSRVINKYFILRVFAYFPFAFILTIYLFFGFLLGFQRRPEHVTTKSAIFIGYLFLLISIGLMLTMFILNYVVGL